MKSVILLLSMATNVIAYEQMYAINAGGAAHTDSDGIVYRGREEKHRNLWDGRVKSENIPKQDNIIYQNFEHTEMGVGDKPLRHNVPVKTDGFYVLIVKYFAAAKTNENYITLNDEIQILSNVNVEQLCGGFLSTCDKYFYFCVTDKMLHFNNKSTLLRNGEMQIELHSLTERTFISGLVLLKGTLGERLKLKSSNTNEFLDFDPKNMDPKCSGQASQVQAQEEQHLDITSEERKASCEGLQNVALNTLALQSLQIQLNESFNLQQKSIDSCCQMSWKNLNQQVSQATSNQILMHQNISCAQFDIKVEKLQSDFGHKIDKNFETLQKFDKKTSETQAEMKKSIERNHESNYQMFIQQMHIHNSLTELTSKSNQANKNMEALQASVQQLVDDNQKMRAEIKQMTDKMALEVPAEQESFKSAISEITNQLKVILEVVLTNEEASK
jgi:Malectin domain